jgi:hypothetical protein
VPNQQSQAEKETEVVSDQKQQALDLLKSIENGDASPVTSPDPSVFTGFPWTPVR